MGFNFGPWIKVALTSTAGVGEDSHFGTGPKRLWLNEPHAGELLLFVFSQASYTMLSTGWTHLSTQIPPDLTGAGEAGETDVWAKISDGTEDYVRWTSSSLTMRGAALRIRAQPFDAATGFADYLTEDGVNNAGLGYGAGPFVNSDMGPYIGRPNTLLSIVGVSFTSGTYGPGADAGDTEAGIYSTIADRSGGAFTHGFTIHAAPMEQTTGGDEFYLSVPGQGIILGSIDLALQIVRGGWEIDRIAIG